MVVGYWYKMVVCSTVFLEGTDKIKQAEKSTTLVPAARRIEQKYPHIPLS